jgi:peptide subunit release factor 1 (eRF1)
MTDTPEEMRLRDIAIGLQAELNEAVYQREKVELLNAELHNKILDLRDRLRLEEVAQEALLKASQQATEKLLRVIAERDVEITAIRQSHTWKIGSLVLAPVRWIKRRKR